MYNLNFKKKIYDGLKDLKRHWFIYLFTCLINFFSFIYIYAHLKFEEIALEHLLLFKVVVFDPKLPESLRLQSDRIRS